MPRPSTRPSVGCRHHGRQHRPPPAGYRRTRRADLDRGRGPLRPPPSALALPAGESITGTNRSGCHHRTQGYLAPRFRANSRLFDKDVPEWGIKTRSRLNSIACPVQPDRRMATTSEGGRQDFRRIGSEVFQERTARRIRTDRGITRYHSPLIQRQRIPPVPGHCFPGLSPSNRRQPEATAPVPAGRAAGSSGRQSTPVGSPDTAVVSGLPTERRARWHRHTVEKIGCPSARASTVIPSPGAVGAEPRPFTERGAWPAT